MKGQFGEPWETTVGGDWIILKDDGSNVAHCRGATPHNTVRAARIVACVNAMDGIPDPVEAVEKAREAMRDVLIGGNHLALHIGSDHPPFTATDDEARAHYRAMFNPANWMKHYDIWVAWSKIMVAREALAALGDGK